LLLTHKSEKELRQEDLLAPFHFLVAIEGLVVAIRQGEIKWIVKGIKVGRTKICINML